MSEPASKMPTSSRSALLLNAVTQLIDRNRDRYGVLLDYFEDLPLRKVVKSLGGPGQVYVSLVGLPGNGSEAYKDWAQKAGFAEIGFGIGATHAVEVRNSEDVEESAIRLVVVGESTERLHSLRDRGYLHIDAVEIRAEITRLRQRQAANEPQSNLWRALASVAVATKISLSEILDYAAALDESDDALHAPREELPKLGLLRDYFLFKDKSTDAIERRLLKNREIIDRFRDAKESDRQTAHEALQNATELEIGDAEKAYGAFLRLRRGDLSAVEDLRYSEAVELLKGGKKRPKKPTAPRPEVEGAINGEGDEDDEGIDTSGPSSIQSTTEATTRLCADGDREAVTELAREFAEHLSNKGADSKTLNIESFEIRLEPDSAALHLSRALLSEDKFGGTVRFAGNLQRTLDDLGRNLESARPYGDRKMEELRLFMDRAGEFQDEFRGLDLLDYYLSERRSLLPFLDLLAADPLLALVGSDEIFEAAREAVEAYVRLLSHLKEQYSVLHQESPAGAATIAGRLLSLDLVVFEGIGGEPEAAIVLPVNPLTLWKQLELAELLRSRSGELSPEDREFLIKDLRDVPEPLLALLVPSDGEDSVTMVQVDRVGPLPLYRPSAESTADVGDDSIAMAAERLAMLYPPVKEHLRICLLNPQSLDFSSRAIERLVTQEDAFRQITLIIISTGESEAPKVNNILGELHAEGRVTLHHVNRGSTSEIEKYLARRPVHILVVAGRRERHVAFVAQEATRLHPLAVPHQIVADRITESVRIEPRSARPENGWSDSHPYGPYFDVVAVLSNRRHQDPTHFERHEAGEIDLSVLSLHTQFCVVAGAGASRLKDSLLYLAQGGLAGDQIFTAHERRIVSEIERLLRGWNYAPSEDGLHELLKRLEELGGEGLFAAFTSKASGGLAKSKLREKVGLAVALDWYGRQFSGENYLVVSLDGPRAQAWLSRRPDKRRADLLGFRLKDDGTVAADILEVKSYQATGEGITESLPVEQLRAVARLLLQILSGTGDLLLDRRRELLRRQVYVDGMLGRTAPSPVWVRKLNDALDGILEIEVNLILVETAFNEPSAVGEEKFHLSSTVDDEAAKLPLRRVRLGEAAIQPLLGGLLARSNTAAENQDLGERQYNIDEGEESLPIEDSVGTSESAAHGVFEEQDSARFDEEVGNGSQPPDGLGIVKYVGAGQESLGSEERDWVDSKAKELYRCLQEYGVSTGAVDPGDVDIGPSLIRYKVRLRPGESVGKLRRIAEELQRELALNKPPIADNLPGTKFAYVDLPRPSPKTAALLPVLQSVEPPSRYSFPAGFTPAGQLIWLDLTQLPHMLVAGETGSGKSVFLRTIISSLAFFNSSDQVRLILVDPKRTDFLLFNNLEHLKGGKIISEAEEAIEVLGSLLENELEDRTALLEEGLFLNIQSYNEQNAQAPIAPIVVVIDEFADLADLLGSRGAEREEFDLSLRRLAQRARNVGIHLIIATQRPTTDIVNGTIKANLPCKVSFRLGSGVDSRTILDEGGAEHLFGRGDLLLKQAGESQRLQGLYLSEAELRQLVEDIG